MGFCAQFSTNETIIETLMHTRMHEGVIDEVCL